MQSYSSPYTGAFSLNTGDKVWDQNLSSLGSLLFPDQSKVAQAYHYGSEARKLQIESGRLQDQTAAGHAGLAMQFGVRPNPTYRTDAFGTTIMNDPYDPAYASQAAPTPAPAPGPTAPPAPPGSPVAPAQAPSTLGAAITQLPPEALGGGIVAGVENNTSSGTLPPMAPATAVSGPEPTTTTSNGMSPQNAPRNIQPGSVTSAGGGGRIYAPPGAADGTPSPVNFNFGQYVGLLVQSGMPFQAAQAAATATLGNMMKNGQMSVPLAENIAAFMGAPSMRNQVIANEGALATTRLTAGATVEAARVRERGETARKGMEQQLVVTDPITGEATLKPLSTMQGLGGTPTFSPEAVKAGVAPIQVQPGGQGTASYSMPTGRAQQPQPGAPGQPPQPGMPLYQQSTEDIRQTQLGAVINVIDPKNPTTIIPATVEEARKNGWPAVPKTQEEWNSLAAYASANAPPEQAQQIREKVLQFATSTAPKATNANETRHEKMLLDAQLQSQMPVPTTTVPFGNIRTNTNPAGTSPNLEIALTDLTDQYFRRDPATKGNQIASANKAIQQMIDEKYIDLKQSRSIGLRGDTTTINKGILQEDGTVAQVPHFRVDLIDPNTQKPYAEGKVPQIKMRSTLGTAITPGPTGPAPRGPAPSVTGARPAGAAPTATPAARPAPGLPEGHTGTGSDGSRWIVRGGSWVPQ